MAVIGIVVSGMIFGILLMEDFGVLLIRWMGYWEGGNVLATRRLLLHRRDYSLSALDN